MIRFKQIRIYPSNWTLDVYIAANHDKRRLSEIFHKKYGASVDYYYEEIVGNQVMSIQSTDLSESQGKLEIVMILCQQRLDVIVHELIHVIWHYSNNCGVEMTYQSQEWQAVLFEYLFEEVREFNTYKKL